ncbi:RHS repeat-associated core domain-containing protein [Pseudomonas sp. CM27]|uniref:RHS repeat-associated core domain-containing protein n=1 Tax=Pseudomonas sp. CM27 TaxID=2738452 RepID=UPI0015549EAD|nr:RHS repeat-associated core domain-containing protein [Pseudomonas sp. CM27]
MIRHGHPRGFTAYGASNGLSGSRLAFCGEYRDSMTGHYHLGNGHRTYNPILMRFHGADALSPFGMGGINTYTYCTGDPINRVDRNGGFSMPNAIFLTGLLEGALNIVDGVLSAFNLVVQRRGEAGSSISFAKQFQVWAKTHKGTLKVAAAAVVWSEQGGPSMPSVTDSVVIGAAATSLGITERSLNIQHHATEVGAYLTQNPAEIPGVVMETVGILSGVTPVLTLGWDVVQKIRGDSVRPNVHA